MTLPSATLAIYYRLLGSLVLLPFGMQHSLSSVQTERDFIYRTSVHCETLFLVKMFNGIQHPYVIGHKKTLTASRPRLGLLIYIYHDIKTILDIEGRVRYHKCIKHFEIKKFDSDNF